MKIGNVFRVLAIVALVLSLHNVKAEEVSGGIEVEQGGNSLKVEADLAYAKEKYKKAGKLYRKLAESASTASVKATYLLKSADSYFEANKTVKAMEVYTDLIKTYPLYIPFEHVAGRIRILAERYADGGGTFLGIRDREGAISAYYLIIQEAPAISVSLKDRTRLAELLTQAGRKEEAVGVYQEALKLNPGLDDLRLDMAQLLIDISKSGDGDGAIKRSAERHARIILDKNPGFHRAEEARLVLAEAREQESRRMLELGKFYLRTSSLKPQAARGYLMELTQRFPGTKAAWEAGKLLDEHPALKTAESQEKAVE